MVTGRSIPDPSTKYRAALLGPPKSIHEFRLRHTAKSEGGFVGLLDKVGGTKGQTRNLFIHLNKNFTHRDLADPFVRRMIYLDASMAANNLVIQGTTREHNYGNTYTRLLDTFVANFVPARNQEAVWRLIKNDHVTSIKKPATKLVGPPKVLDDFRRSRPDIIEQDRKKPDEHNQLIKKSSKLVAMPEFSKEEKLCLAYDSAARAADMQAEIANKGGQRFDWGDAYTGNVLTILDAASPKEKYALYKRAFEDHLKENKARIASMKR